MGCYAVPAAAWVAHKILGKRMPAGASERLSLLLLGGVVFGFVDHAWNGELLFSREGLIADLLLGLGITVATVAVWGVLELIEKARVPLALEE